MTEGNIYLERYAYQKPQVVSPPANDLGIVIVIPSFAERGIFTALRSIGNCKTPGCHCEVLVVFNHGENADLSSKRINEKTFRDFEDFASKNNSPWLTFHAIYAAGLPARDAGVGLARKIGMDEAAWRFDKIGNPKGVIANFDADCVCDENYLLELWRIFQEKKDISGCTVYFEHPTTDQNGTVNEAIVNYELHIRYYIDALRYAGYPFAFHTVGSCMAVRSDIYQKQGGMNKRKAAEDFYFLHKLFPLGGFYQLNTTAVRPSARMSTRVPFGTGVTMTKYIGNPGDLQTYNWQTFENLHSFIAKMPEIARGPIKSLQELEEEIPANVIAYLDKIGFCEHVNRIRQQATSEAGFLKHFWKWFGGIVLLKYAHFSRDHYFPNQPVEPSVRMLLKHAYQMDVPDADNLGLLMKLRQLDRQSDQ